jgi:hypothetical protein
MVNTLPSKAKDKLCIYYYYRRFLPVPYGLAEARSASFSSSSLWFYCSVNTVRALVSLIKDDQGGYRLAVELHAQLLGIDRAQTQRIMEEGHKTCPYSKAVRGDNSAKLMVD